MRRLRSRWNAKCGWTRRRGSVASALRPPSIAKSSARGIPQTGAVAPAPTAATAASSSTASPPTRPRRAAPHRFSAPSAMGRCLGKTSLGSKSSPSSPPLPLRKTKRASPSPTNAAATLRPRESRRRLGSDLPSHCDALFVIIKYDVPNKETVA